MELPSSPAPVRLRPGLLLFLALAGSVHAQTIAVTNYPDTRVLNYPVALLRGTLANITATSVTVTNTSSTRSASNILPGLARAGQFRALADLVPGENHLLIEEGANQLMFTLRYVPQTNPRFVRPLLYTLSNGSTDYPTPLAGDPQNWRDKLATMMKIMQTFTAESMHDQGYPRLTFNLPITPATGEIQTFVLVGEHDAAFYYNQTYDRSQLWYEAYDLIGRNLPSANAKNVAIVAFSKYDAANDYKFAHTALGGGYLGLMGGLSLWACPDSVADILPTYTDGGTAYPAIQGESAQVYRAANEIIGAALHELGHAMGRPHEGEFDLSIMQRGFDRMYRQFTLEEPGGATWTPERVGNWSPESAAAFADIHPWFQLPPPVARIEDIDPDPLPEALGEILVEFDQAVTGVNLADFSLDRNGAPVAAFASTATLASLSPFRYRVNLGNLAEEAATWTLRLTAAGSGITSATGFSLYDDQAETWTRGADTLPQLDQLAATSITPSSGTLNARLATTGGSATAVTVFWGGSDAGPNAVGWQRTRALGTKTRGPLTVPLTGLNPEQITYFRFRATNALGTAWSEAASFVTLPFVLLPPGAIARYRVPNGPTDDATWFQRNFADGSWASGPSGLGYETSGTDYAGLIGTDLTAAVRNINPSLRARWHFDISSPGALTQATLRLKYDDGFVAWINGQVVASAETPMIPPAWNANATGGHPDAESAQYVDFDLTPFLSLLEPTNNVLAIQVMNETVGSSDILVLPEITGSTNVPVSLLPPGAPARAHVPASAVLGSTWVSPEFGDSSWTAGTTGVGYERSTGYGALIGLDVNTAMYNRNTSCYIRIPFTLADPTVLNSLKLRMKYDDAYIAWINGTRVAASGNAPAMPTWNSAATGIHDDALAVLYEDRDLSSFLPLLREGVNVLAIQGMNDSTTSSDLLILPELVGTRPPIPPLSPYEQWITGFAVSDPAPGADPDGDGLTNEEEFLLGSHPGQPDRQTREPGVTVGAGQVTLTFPVFAGRRYQVEYSSDLALWLLAGPDFIPPSGNPSWKWTDDGTHTGSPPAPQRPRYYRIAVTFAEP